MSGVAFLRAGRHQGRCRRADGTRAGDLHREAPERRYRGAGEYAVWYALSRRFLRQQPI
jgi:hypothetical protein